MSAPVLTPEVVAEAASLRGGINVRHKTGTRHNPKPGQSQIWAEWQVIVGRKVVGRFDLFDQAEDFASALRNRRKAVPDELAARVGPASGEVVG